SGHVARAQRGSFLCRHAARIRDADGRHGRRFPGTPGGLTIFPTGPSETYSAFTTQLTSVGVLVDLSAGASHAILGDPSRTPLAWSEERPRSPRCLRTAPSWIHVPLPKSPHVWPRFTVVVAPHRSCCQIPDASSSRSRDERRHRRATAAISGEPR